MASTNFETAMRNGRNGSRQSHVRVVSKSKPSFWNRFQTALQVLLAVLALSSTLSGAAYSVFRLEARLRELTTSTANLAKATHNLTGQVAVLTEKVRMLETKSDSLANRAAKSGLRR